MIIRTTAIAFAAALLLTGCAQTKVDSSNWTEHWDRLEAEGYDMQACANYLANENLDLYEEQGTDFFKAAGQACAQDAIDTGDVDKFNQRYAPAE